MATYGLELKTGTDNTITIANTQSDMSNYVAVEYGVGTETTADINLAEDLIFIRYNPDTDTSSSSLPQRSVSMSYVTETVPNPIYDPDGGDYPWNQEFIQSPTPQMGFSREVEYIVLKPSSSVTNPAGDYGLQLINKENRVQFDSRTALVDKSIRLETYYPVGSVGLFYDNDGNVLSSTRILDTSFEYFYSMNDVPTTSFGVLGQGTVTSRALIFVPSGTNNYVANVNNPQTINSGVYAATVTSWSTIDLGSIVSSGSSYYSIPQRNDFIVFKGTLVE